MSITPLNFSGLISFDDDGPLASASYYLQDEDDRPTLLAFSLVCTSFRAAALPLLFRDTRVWLRPGRKPDIHTRSFISFLSSHQHIARLINKLTITGTTDGQKGKAESTRVNISDVGKLMAQLSALQTLVFEGVWLSHDLQAQVTRRSGLGHARLKELRLEQMDSLMRPEALFHLLVGGAFASIDRLCVREMGKLVGAKANGPSRSKDHKLRIGVLLLRDVDWSMICYLWAITRPFALMMEVECRGPSDAKSLGECLSFTAVGEQVCDLTVNFAAGLREHANSGCTQRIDILDLNIWKCTTLKSLRTTIYLISNSSLATDVNDRAWDILCTFLSWAPRALTCVTIGLATDSALDDVLSTSDWHRLCLVLNEFPQLEGIWFEKTGCDGCSYNEEAMIRMNLWELEPMLRFVKRRES